MELETLLTKSIADAIKLLPSQGLISVFVHHNTLHNFEDLKFEQATSLAKQIYGYECYMPESYYRDRIFTGDITLEMVEQIIRERYGEICDLEIGKLGRPIELWKTMLFHEVSSPLQIELPWLLTETDLLKKFNVAVSIKSKSKNINEAKENFSRKENINKIEVFERRLGPIQIWSDTDWESVTLRLLWDTCYEKMLKESNFLERTESNISNSIRIPILSKDERVNEILIRFCGVFLDQGFSLIPLPFREKGFLYSFLKLYEFAGIDIPVWLNQLNMECSKWLTNKIDPLQVISHYLQKTEVPESEIPRLIQDQILSLKGWAGVLWQLETNSPWAPKRIPSGTILEYLAVRMMLNYIVLKNSTLGNLPHAEISRKSAEFESSIDAEIGRLTYNVFSLAQHSGWSVTQLLNESSENWRHLIQSIQLFNSDIRRIILHNAFEECFYNKTISAISQNIDHRKKFKLEKQPAKRSFQIVCCIDDREESFRRHLEEVDSGCETFASAGFYYVAMYYHGSDEAHFRPLCPQSITPKNWVVEVPTFTSYESNSTRKSRRRFIGLLSREIHLRSKSILGGMIVGIFGSIAGIGMFARVLFPSLTSKLNENLTGLIKKPLTELNLEKNEKESDSPEIKTGFSISEMALIVEKTLRDISLITDFTDIVIFVGHGSSSVNNPHESAYNCGACSGGRGGPNARAFAQMANDARVRAILRSVGISIPDNVHFVGAYHDTCRDKFEFFDLDRIPPSQRARFRNCESSILKALTRNAHERCRRFGHETRTLNRKEAIDHVLERSEDLSQPRPEYNHATNAICLVGKRAWSKGLFLDRRSFLMSYDPIISNDTDGIILERILQAVIPVCAGINLEYYFSTVDPEGFGCGSKLPHNVVGLAGVTSGSSSDLRPGLSSQMVEIHDPIRIIFVIETNETTIRRIIKENEGIRKLVENEWVRLTILNPELNEFKTFSNGIFVTEDFDKQILTLPQEDSSYKHYTKSSLNLDFAIIK